MAHLHAMLLIYARQGDQITVRRIFDAKAKLARSAFTQTLPSAHARHATCDCDDGYLYEHRCCGQMIAQPSGVSRCCLTPETITRECDGCGGTGVRML